MYARIEVDSPTPVVSSAGFTPGPIDFFGRYTYEVTGTAAQVTTAIDNFTVKASFNVTLNAYRGMPYNETMLISREGHGHVNFQFGLYPPPEPKPPSAIQIKDVVNDTMKFYYDQRHGNNTSADLAKLTTDVKGLNLTQDTLRQVLANALQPDCGVIPTFSHADWRASSLVVSVMTLRTTRPRYRAIYRPFWSRRHSSGEPITSWPSTSRPRLPWRRR